MVFQLIFKVRTPIIVDGPMHLDALLAAVHPAAHNQEIFLTRRSAAEDVHQIPLEIDRAWMPGGMWVCCCSTADYSDDAKPFSTKLATAKKPQDYFYLNAMQTPRTGPGRDRLDTVYGVACSSVSFLVSARKASKLDRLAKRVKNIGGLRKAGYGEVVEYELLERPDLDWRDCLVSKDGFALRNMPAEMVESDEITSVVVRAPYWVSSMAVPGVTEGASIRLRSEVELREDCKRKSGVDGCQPGDAE